MDFELNLIYAFNFLRQLTYGWILLNGGKDLIKHSILLFLVNHVVLVAYLNTFTIWSTAIPLCIFPYTSEEAPRGFSLTKYF